MKRTLALAALALTLTVGAACEAESTAKPIPQSGAIETPAAETPKVELKATTTTTEAAVKATSCDVAREALLTGTQAQIEAALRGLIADKTADGTAREYADYYLHRDGPGSYASKDMREMDVGLIRMSCS